MVNSINIDELKNVAAEMRCCRENAGISLVELSKIIKVRRIYLEALEAADTSVLKFEAYVFGYIKAYAKHFDLDYEVLVERIKIQSSKKLKSGASENRVLDEVKIPSFKVLLLSAIALVFVIICSVAIS